LAEIDEVSNLCALCASAGKQQEQLANFMRSCILIAWCLLCATTVAGGATVDLQRDDTAGKLTITVDGREVLAYQYAAGEALPHYWPVRSPSGQLLTDQVPDPYPHHRSLWIADHLQAADAPAVDFYHCWKNYRVAGQAESGFKHMIRHEEFDELQAQGHRATVTAKLRWVLDQTRPIIDERRTLRFIALDDGQYLVDLAWELRPSKAAVKFVSDSVHYAWPYVRMHPRFSGSQGGTITNDREMTGEAATNGQVAKWIDYSNTVEGTTEGLTIFLWPDGQTHRWLTREYGTFGPRRADEFSGTGFTLQPGESLHGRVGLLIHRGDVASGQVARRYQQYLEGQP
jgi:hypothetical protein